MTADTDNHSLEKLVNVLKALFKERDWDQFHSPKNLAMNLMIESAELAEIFTWIPEAQSLAITDKIRANLGMKSVMFF